MPENPEDKKSAPATSPKNATRRKITLVVVGFGVLIVAAYIGFMYLTVWQFEPSTQDAYIHADYVTIAPQVAGNIVEVGVQDNQPVRKGDLIAQIDPVPYQAAVNEAEAEVEHTKAQITQIEAELATQPSIVAEARAAVEVSAAAFKMAQENLVRYNAMAKDGASTVQASQQATSQFGQVQATADLHKAALTAAKKKTIVLNAELAAAKAGLKESEAELVNALFNLKCARVVAPIDGVVGNRALRLGMYVQPGTQLLNIVPLHAVYVQANYKETNLGRIEPGQPVSIYVDTFPNTPLRGVVNSLSPAAGQTFALLPPDNATGNFTKIVQRVPVKILIDPKDALVGRLRPGMSVTAKVHTKGEKLDPQIFLDVAPGGADIAVPATLAPGGTASPSEGSDQK